MANPQLSPAPAAPTWMWDGASGAAPLDDYGQRPTMLAVHSDWGTACRCSRFSRSPTSVSPALDLRPLDENAGQKTQQQPPNAYQPIKTKTILLRLPI